MTKNGKERVSSGLPRLVRQVNLQAVVRQMRRMEAFSKVDLARRSGISTTTMTKLFAQLEASGVIERGEVSRESFGRPKTLFRLSPALQVAAIVIDVEETAICFSGLQAELKDSAVTFPTGNIRRDLFARIGRAFVALRDQLQAPCRLVGVCIPGLIQSDTGKSILNPNLHWLEGINPAEQISRKLGIRATIMHEEKALCRAQQRANDELYDYIVMDFSSGVGMGVVTNGKYLSGSSGFAGEIGHVIMQPGGKLCGCGNRGCLETIASDRVFQAAVGLPMEEALQRLAAGNAKAAAAAGRVVRAQAKGVASVINIFNPKRIFVYSHLSEAYPAYLDTLRREVRERAIDLSFRRCRIETTHEGKLKGALLQTIDSLIETAILGAE